MSEAPSVFTVILNWNGLADTRECLATLREATYQRNRVVVVDNGSQTDEAGALEGEFGDFIRVIRNPKNVGFAGGANTGIRYALEHGADYVLLLNNDVTVDPVFLSALVSAAEGYPDVAAVCPKAYFRERPDVIYSTGGSVNLWAGIARQVGRGQQDRGQFERPAARDYADGLCLLAPASAFRTVGLLDEDYFAYWEETDWCFRARRRGLRCYYVPQAKVWHRAARSQSPDSDYYYLYRRNAFLFVRKRGRPIHLATALALHLFVLGPLYFARHPRRIGRALAEARAIIWHARNQARQRPLV